MKAKWSTMRRLVLTIVSVAGGAIAPGVTAYWIALDLTPARITAGATVTVVIAGAIGRMQLAELYREERLEHAQEDPAQLLRRRIRAINTALNEAATVMDQLRRELQEQQLAGERLIAEAENQQRLLAVDKEQAESIRQILISETDATLRAERRQQWMFFALGVLASIPIGVVINLLVP